MINANNKTFNKTLFLALITFALMIIAQFNKPEQKTKKVDVNLTMFTISPALAKVITFGQEKAISGYLWMKTLLDMDLKHVEDNKRSWVYHRFNLISILNPKFYENYLYGGMHLSIVKDDVIGAELLYKKGYHHYKTKEDLIWNRAFNLYYEIGDLNTALPLFKYLSELESPKYKSAGRIAAKIEAGIGSLEEAFVILYNSYTRMKPSILKEKTTQTLYVMKAEIDTQCLNSAKTYCHKKDFLGNPYIKKDGLFIATKTEWLKENIRIIKGRDK